MKVNFEEERKLFNGEEEEEEDDWVPEPVGGASVINPVHINMEHQMSVANRVDEGLEEQKDRNHNEGVEDLGLDFANHNGA